MKKTLEFLLLVLLLPTISCSEVINIGNQTDFNNLSSSINSAVASGAKDIVVEFAPSTYYFNEDHLALARKQWPGVSISIHGNGSTIVSKGKDYVNGQLYASVYNTNHGFVSLNHGDVPVWGKLLQADDLIEVADESTKLCCLTCSDITQDMPADKCKNIYINLTQWFKSNTYKVSYIKDSNIFFKANDLSFNKARDCYSVNLDYGFGKATPRFRLCNMPQAEEPLVTISNNRITLPPGIDSIHLCSATRFLNVTNSSLASIDIDSLTFLGNKNSKTALLQLTSNTLGAFKLSRCHFKAIQSDVVKIDTTDNANISLCEFQECYRNGIYTTCSANTSITNNTFTHMGLAINNSFCIRSAGKNIYIAHNTLKDYGYGGIAVGTWWASPKKMVNTGIVEHNYLFYTDAYMEQWQNHSLMDSGAIYLYTQCDNMQVRYNFINNYNGAYLNRGIFCDDGALNFRIHSNIVTNIANSFAIDSRRTLGIEKDPKSHTPTVNINNRIYDNIISAPIRFEGRNANANCMLGTNLLLGKASVIKVENIMQNLQQENSFLNINQWSITDGKLTIPEKHISTLHKLPEYKELGKWIAIQKR